MSEKVKTVEEDYAEELETFKRTANVTVEDVARAWASMDGKHNQFDASKGRPLGDPKSGGYYDGYMHEAAEVLARAVKYARARKSEDARR